MPLVFLEKKEYGMQKMEKQVYQASINDIQLERVQVLLPGIVMKYMAHQTHYTYGSCHGNTNPCEEEADEKINFIAMRFESLVNKRLHQSVTFPNEEGDGGDSEKRVIPFNINPEIMVNFTNYRIQEGIKRQNQDKNISIPMPEHKPIIKWGDRNCSSLN
jgi:hypothetical protein